MEQELLDKNIRLCQKGRAEAFGWLIKAYGPRLYGYFLRRSGSAAEAQELLQELYLRLVKGIKGYRHEGHFESWLFRIAANLARDRVRRRQRRPTTVSLSGGSNGEDGPGARLVADELSPDEQASRREQMGAIGEALEQLGQLDREIILLRHYGGLSFREIAEHFDIPLGTALAKVHRGLKQVRKIIEEKR